MTDSIYHCYWLTSSILLYIYPVKFQAKKCNTIYIVYISSNKFEKTLALHIKSTEKVL